MKKLPRRTRDPCRRSERTAKAGREASRPVRYIFYFAANVRCIRRASDERRYENLSADDVIFVTIAPTTGSKYLYTFLIDD